MQQAQNIFDTKYNKQLLIQYLKKIYGSEKAKQILEKHKNNLWEPYGVAYSLGKRSIEYFCLMFLQNTFVPSDNNSQRSLAPVHYEVWDLLQRQFIKDEFDKANIIIPRGTAKTTTCDLALTVWLHCYGLSKFTVIGAKKEEDAFQFIGNVRKQLEENPYIEYTFGKLINKRFGTVNKQEIELTNETCIKAVSSGSSVRGMNYKGTRPTVFIADDYQDANDVLSEEAREKKWKKWNDEIEEFGDTAVIRDGKKIKSATKIICIGTIMHNSCLISRLMQAKDYITMLRRAILLEPDQTVEDIFDTGLWAECKRIVYNNKLENPVEDGYQFYLKHKLEMDFPILWEDKWDRFNDLAIKYWKNKESFMQEKMNDASNIGEKKFKSNRVESPEEIESHTFTNVAARSV
ncbi:hypothetical protein [Acetivibrio cellulolyticus]|uniref:hypothetical protein n=1 Tax=Acetivibrio cellulolyticus TaxID=35830 RepID=UPI0001E2BDC1|nr:hypothetical protein [Acetivibrio cellulolyticus]